MWQKRRRRATLDDVVELLDGLGTMLQVIDGRLEEIVSLLKEEDGEAGS